jgi:hypothetical protein
MAFDAFQAALVGFELHGGLAHRANEDLQQFFADCHKKLSV